MPARHPPGTTLRSARLSTWWSGQVVSAPRRSSESSCTQPEVLATDADEAFGQQPVARMRTDQSSGSPRASAESTTSASSAGDGSGPASVRRGIVKVYSATAIGCAAPANA